jgi:hypothetical protein
VGRPAGPRLLHSTPISASSERDLVANPDQRGCKTAEAVLQTPSHRSLHMRARECIPRGLASQPDRRSCVRRPIVRRPRRWATGSPNICYGWVFNSLLLMSTDHSFGVAGFAHVTP